MREELPKKPLFIHTQDWYRTTVCVDCPEFNFVPLPEGAVAYCNRVEDDKSCIFYHTESGDEENRLDTQTLLNLESVQRVEA
ncbi:MAG: hypothetical protein NWF12_03855 [Candidatus Bathyarchaeota archaeon]|jgi:hypothetical protein|nr:hypothetical protein [Candidatus Bathyarchaeota archaeon]